MNFLFNAKITDKALFEIFIKSIKSFPFTNIIFNIEDCTGGEIEQIINDTFDQSLLTVNNSTNRRQEEWQETISSLSGDLIWICSRYDHFFVDENIEHLVEVLRFRREAGTDKLASISISNWVNNLTKCVIIDHGIWDGEKHPAPTQAWITIDDCDSYQIATMELCRSWFFDQEFSDIEFESVEDLNASVDFIRPWKIQVPSRQILRSTSERLVENDFFDTKVDANTRKTRLIKYYLQHIPYNRRCLANPKYERGIFDRVLRYYGYKRKI